MKDKITKFDVTELFILIKKDAVMARLTGREVKHAFTDKEVSELEEQGWEVIAYIQGKFGFTMLEGEV